MAAKPTPEQSFLLDLFVYDDELGTLFYKRNSGPRVAGTEAGYINNRGYRKVTADGKQYYMHRIIWKMHYGVDPQNEIDHINRNKLDNRLCNLRDVTGTENNRNKLPPRGSDFVGVYFNKKKNRWQARLQVHVGWFQSAEEAASARDNANLLVQSALERM